MTEHISLRYFTTPEGVRIDYAHIVRRYGASTLTQSLLLSRLSLSQRKTAQQAASRERSKTRAA